MRKIVHKLFWLWEFEKEEQWLNEMAAKGLCLVGVGWCRYEFEETLPGEYGIRLELLENKLNHPESARYIEFLEETGAQQVGSWMRWVYLRKKKTDGEFQLFSDNASRINHLTRILRLIGIIGGMNLWIAIYNLLLVFLWDSSANLLGLLNLALGLLCLGGFIRLWQKRKKLRAQQQLFE